MQKKPVNELIVDFLGRWDSDTNCEFLQAVHELYKLYDVDEDDDWLKDVYGDETDNIRLIRTVYLISKFADKFTYKLANTTREYKGLWQRIEQEALRIGKSEI